MTQNENSKRHTSDISGSRTGSTNEKKFIITTALHTHVKHLQDIALRTPTQLVGMYVYILHKVCSWRRAFIIEFI